MATFWWRAVFTHDAYKMAVYSEKLVEVVNVIETLVRRTFTISLERLPTRTAPISLLKCLSKNHRGVRDVSAYERWAESVLIFVRTSLTPVLGAVLQQCLYLFECSLCLAIEQIGITLFLGMSQLTALGSYQTTQCVADLGRLICTWWEG